MTYKIDSEAYIQRCRKFRLMNFSLPQILGYIEGSTKSKFIVKSFQSLGFKIKWFQLFLLLFGNGLLMRVIK